MRAIDFHVHLPTPDWLDGSMAGYVEAAEVRIDYAHPLKLDAVAAAHPELTVVAAHFGWPWQMDLIAVALHKTNVYIDISGWSPKRIPPEVVRELSGRLPGQFVWGSDFRFSAKPKILYRLPPCASFRSYV